MRSSLALHGPIVMDNDIILLMIGMFGAVVMGPKLKDISLIAARTCTVDLEEHPSLFMIAQTIAGSLLFLFASKLSSSMFFRLGTGSAGVMLLSVLILLLLVSR